MTLMTILVTFWFSSSSKKHSSLDSKFMNSKDCILKNQIPNKPLIKMVKLVLEYLFYLLGYVLLMIFKCFSPLQCKQISKFDC
jgi:hypothetical protein